MQYAIIIVLHIIEFYRLNKEVSCMNLIFVSADTLDNGKKKKNSGIKKNYRWHQNVT